jgi:hypothetical protein
MVTLCNRHGEKMIWITTAGWIVWGFIMYKLGWRTGIGDGTYVTLTELNKQKIIHIDPKTEEISPGSARKQHMEDVVNKVGSD